MELSRIISDLLYRYECVIVPDFGGFLCNHQSARIDTFSNNFYPPYKKLSFNSQLVSNDGLLANHIAQTLQMNYDKAMDFIKEEVNHWREKLISETLLLPNIGSLQKQDEKILFEPSNNVNYLTTSFGLSDFAAQEIIRREGFKPVATIIEKEPIVLSTARKAPNYLKYAAIFVLGISTIGFAGKIYQQYKGKEISKVIETQQMQMEEKIERATFEIAKPLPMIHLDILAQKKNYHVIAGAFRFPENAETRVEQLKNLGYDARIIGVNKWGLTVVALESYKSKEESEAVLQEVRKSAEKDAWILFQEL